MPRRWPGADHDPPFGLLTMNQAARQAELTIQHLTRLCNDPANGLVAAKVGSVWLVTQESLEDFIDKRQKG